MRMVCIIVPPLLMMAHSSSLPFPPLARPEGREITTSNSNQGREGSRAETLEGGGDGRPINPTEGEGVYHSGIKR
jgi:hypothetical protein